MNTTFETTYTVTVPEDKGGVRLDRVLSEEVPGLSRTRIKSLVADGLVRIGGAEGEAVVNPSRKVKAGEAYVICVPPAAPAEPEAQDIPLDVVYEDDDVIVIDKPPGLVVHPASGNPDGTLVNALLAHCGDSLSGIGGVARPGIVHRLDKGTGGLMVAAKNDAAHESLCGQFASHTLDRAYVALVWGVPHPTQGEIEGNIGRSSHDRKKMAVVKSGGKYALTRYKVLEAYGTTASLVECRLATGRTHQIRVHMASIGHPLLGDPVYGGAGRGRRTGLSEAARGILESLDHQALYAFELGFSHPISGEKLLFRREFPIYISELSCSLKKV
ncbi:MAG: RluA family pseudouridine synthase [Alphaproteobacteria bacterium]|nr:RluA family pseudouridine synthase [Alphaproteobacteria bacterium]MBF0250816.1 RluA family pseudouridine synthase [Alphaproteobacteria bacterium]